MIKCELKFLYLVSGGKKRHQKENGKEKASIPQEQKP
jgi:hypothetical protein